MPAQLPTVREKKWLCRLQASPKLWWHYPQLPSGHSSTVDWSAVSCSCPKNLREKKNDCCLCQQNKDYSMRSVECVGRESSHKICEYKIFYHRWVRGHIIEVPRPETSISLQSLLDKFRASSFLLSHVQHL